MVTNEPFDVATGELLAKQAADGDLGARDRLLALLWPAWLAMVESHPSMGSLARSQDHVRNVATKLLEKIGRRDGHTLQLYALWLERHPGKTFLDWIRIATANAVRNYVTEQLGPRPSSNKEPSAKRLLNELASSAFLDEVGVRPRVTTLQTARELLEFAEENLPSAQYEVLGLWLQGSTFEDIAAGLRLGEEEVKRLQRAAIATLRRSFGREAGGEGKNVDGA